CTRFGNEYSRFLMAFFGGLRGSERWNENSVCFAPLSLAFFMGGTANEPLLLSERGVVAKPSSFPQARERIFSLYPALLSSTNP
ncbi:hypothetical protein, partial [uncultured Mitsuokella sp.]|uniref:hypothetical protein n=1 Tax=uncultured Mitsuokella sp. TaxID=453120 RepID=UPI0025ECA574